MNTQTFYEGWTGKPDYPHNFGSDRSDHFFAEGKDGQMFWRGNPIRNQFFPKFSARDSNYFVIFINWINDFSEYPSH